MLWTYLVGIVLLAKYQGGYSQCQSGAESYYLSPYGEICYWILSLHEPTNAADSETGCRNENGELAYIPDIHALITVMQLLTNNNANVSGWYAYLGYSRVNSSTTLLEIQNKGIYQTWIPWDQLMDQPLQSDLGCIALHGTSGFWHDMHCANNIKAICSTPYPTDTIQAPAIQTTTTTTTQEPTTTTITHEPTTTTTTTQEPTTTTTTQEPTTTTTTQEPTTTTTTQEPTTTTTTREPTTTTTTQEPTTTTTTQEPTTTTATQEPTTTTTTQEPTTTTATQEPTTTTTTQEPTTTTTTQEPTTTTTTREPTTTAIQASPPTTITTTTEGPKTTTMTTDELTTTTTTTDEATTAAATMQEPTTTRISIEDSATSSSMDCLCPCDHSPYTEFYLAVNMTDELQTKLDSLKEETRVDEDTLSSTIRKRTSAHDPRPSSTYVGYLGIALLSLIFGGLFLSDLLRVIITLKLIS